jgi:hypothetical protein
MWERNIDNPNNITAKYIGCEIHLYIPLFTNGAPGLGIGEILSEGRSARKAKIIIAKPVTENIVKKTSALLLVNIKTFPGLRKSRINKLN